MFGGSSTFGTNNNTTGGTMNSGFSFGNNNNNNTNTATTGGLFGQQQQQQQPSAASGGLFGQQQQPAATSGLFGAKPGTTGGMFGAQNNTTAPGATGGLFGAKPAAPASGGLFGAQNTTAPPTGGLFGAKPAAPATGGLFGAQNTTAPATGGMFGAKPAASTLGGGMFGAQNTTAPATGGLFGAKPAGQTLGGGLFGAQQQPQQQQPLQAQQPTLTNQPSFAWSQNNNTTQQVPQQQNTLSFLQQQPQPSQQPNQPSIYALQQQQTTANYPQQIQEQIIKCRESWDPASYKSKLRSFVYNKVNETDAMLYTKPPYILQEEWDQAMERKPKGNYNVIPIQLNGFDDLNQRNQLQIENVAQIRLILKEMLDKNTQLQQRHELDTAARILKVQSRNIQIEKRILKLGSQLAILKNRGLPMSINEEKMWTQFKTLLKRSEDPAVLGKTNELWARLSVLKERAKNISDQLDNTLIIINDGNKKDSGATATISTTTSNNTTSGSNFVGNETNSIDKIAHILSNQQRGISYLNSIIENDNQVIDKIIKH